MFMNRKEYRILAIVVFSLIGLIASLYLLDFQIPSNNIGKGDATTTPTPTTQIPTNNAGWDSLVTWANKPMDIIGELPCTAGEDTRGLKCKDENQTPRVMFAKAIVGMRTNNQTMIDEAKAELDKVPEAVRTWTEVTPSKDSKWGERHIPLIAVTA